MVSRESSGVFRAAHALIVSLFEWIRYTSLLK